MKESWLSLLTRGAASVPGIGLSVTCISSCPSYYYNYMQMGTAEHCDGRDDIWAGPWSLAKVWNCGKRGREARRGHSPGGCVEVGSTRVG